MGRGGVQAREEIRGDTMMGLKRDLWQGGSREPGQWGEGCKTRWGAIGRGKGRQERSTTSPKAVQDAGEVWP